jgi:hypothetical protein
MRENRTSGSRWQGVETGHGRDIEALSEETERNWSVCPKPWRHSLTLPADAAVRRARSGDFWKQVSA